MPQYSANRPHTTAASLPAKRTKQLPVHFLISRSWSDFFYVPVEQLPGKRVDNHPIHDVECRPCFTGLTSSDGSGLLGFPVAARDMGQILKDSGYGFDRRPTRCYTAAHHERGYTSLTNPRSSSRPSSLAGN